MKKNEINIAIKKDLLVRPIRNSLHESNFTGDFSQIENFIDKKFNVIDQNIKSSSSRLITTNYIKFLNERKTISGKVLLEAVDDSVEQVDKTALFTDLAEVQGNLADSFAKLYTYKTQYIDNPNWKISLSQLRINISEMMNKLSSTMAMIGLENDKPNNSGQ